MPGDLALHLLPSPPFPLLPFATQQTGGMFSCSETGKMPKSFPQTLQHNFTFSVTHEQLGMSGPLGKCQSEGRFDSLKLHTGMFVSFQGGQSRPSPGALIREVSPICTFQGHILCLCGSFEARRPSFSLVLSAAVQIHSQSISYSQFSSAGHSGLSPDQRPQDGAFRHCLSSPTVPRNGRFILIEFHCSDLFMFFSRNIPIA